MEAYFVDTVGNMCYNFHVFQLTYFFENSIDFREIKLHKEQSWNDKEENL